MAMGWVRALCVLRGFGVWFVVFLFGRLVGEVAWRWVGRLVYAMISAQLVFAVLSVLASIILFGEGYRGLMGLRASSGCASRAVAISLILSLPVTFLINFLGSASGLARAGTPLLIPVILILSPVGEELLFRGLLLGCLMKCIGRWSSIMLSSMVFALAHLLALRLHSATSQTVFLVFAGALILGLVAGYFRASTSSLVPAIIAHSIFNLSGIITGAIIRLLA